MSDIFVSYANQDREVASRLSCALEESGWSVWWDTRIDVGETFDEVIEHELENARCVIVLWSSNSVKSEWVKNEAAEAVGRGVLLPVRIDNVKPPLEFRRKQTHDLLNWSGKTKDEDFGILLEAVARITKQDKIQGQPGKMSQAQYPRLKNRHLILAGAVIGTAIAFFVFLEFGGDSSGASPANTQRDENASLLEQKTARSTAPADSVEAEERNAPALLKPDIQRSQPGSRDNPLIIDLDKTYLVILEKNGESFFQLSGENGELALVLDSVLTNGRNSNMQSTLSVLDSDGVVIKDDLLGFNEIDSGFRKTATVPIREPGKYGFKILNKSNSSEFWLTVMERATFRFVPFAGEGIPSKLLVDEPGTGKLDKYQSHFYRISLSKGEYKVLLDFTNVNGANTNIKGYLAVLNAFGGGQTERIRFNEIDVSYRKAHMFSLDEARTLIWRVKSKSSSIRYQLRILKH